MGPNPQFSADLVAFTEEILNEKFHFLYSLHSEKLLENGLLRHLIPAYLKYCKYFWIYWVKEEQFDLKNKKLFAFLSESNKKLLVIFWKRFSLCEMWTLNWSPGIEGLT